MKKILLAAAVAVMTVAPSLARQARPHDAEFRPFYDDFLKAVRANDKEKLADMIAFPVTAWSINRNHNVTTGAIKDRADFLARYNVLFTVSMRTHVLKAKVSPLTYDSAYMTLWREGDIECSFEFEYADGTGYRVVSYSIGPI